MTDHPSWPAELVEKGARRLDESFPRGGEFSVDTWPTVVRIVLSALSGDLVPREEAGTYNAYPGIAPPDEAQALKVGEDYRVAVYFDGETVRVVADPERVLEVDAFVTLKAQADALAEALEEAVGALMASSWPATRSPVSKGLATLASYRSSSSTETEG